MQTKQEKFEFTKISQDTDLNLFKPDLSQGKQDEPPKVISQNSKSTDANDSKVKED